MKLLRYGPRARKTRSARPQRQIRDLSAVVRDIDGALSPASLRLTPARPGDTADGRPDAAARPCVARPVKIVAIGLNYADHAAEAGAPIPKEPIFFMKAIGAICGPNDDVIIPKGSQKTDCEVELGIVIGTKASYIAVHDAPKHIAGYCVVNDVSEREFQIERGGQWDQGQERRHVLPDRPLAGHRRRGARPAGAAAVDRGQRRAQAERQHPDMIFGIDQSVSYVSHFMTLMPGDVIPTGTPSGVGLGFKPPVFLKPGDRMRLSVEGLGVQEQRLVEG